jgi:hypothetical protein
LPGTNSLAEILTWCLVTAYRYSIPKSFLALLLIA